MLVSPCMKRTINLSIPVEDYGHLAAVAASRAISIERYVIDQSTRRQTITDINSSIAIPAINHDDSTKQTSSQPEAYKQPVIVMPSTTAI